MRLGRCNDPQGLAAPSLRLPAGVASGAKGSAITAGAQLAAERAAEDGLGVPAKLERGGRVDPRDRSPGAWGRPLRGERGRPNQVGTRGKPRASRSHWGLARERGALGDRDGGAGRLGQLTCHRARQRRGCLFALRTRPPAGPLACPPPTPPPPSPPPPSPGRPRPPRSQLRMLRLRRPARAAAGRQSHPLTSG